MNTSVVNIFILVYLVTNNFYHVLCACGSKRISCITEASYKFCFTAGKMVMEMGNTKYCPENTVCDENEGNLPCLRKVLVSELAQDSTEITDILNEEKLNTKILVEDVLSKTSTNVLIEISTESLKQEESSSTIPPDQVLENSSTFTTGPSGLSVTEYILEDVTPPASDMETNSAMNDIKIDLLEREPNSTTLIDISKEVFTSTLNPITPAYLEHYTSKYDSETLNFPYSNNDSKFRDEFIYTPEQEEQNLITSTKNILEDNSVSFQQLISVTTEPTLEEYVSTSLKNEETLHSVTTSELSEAEIGLEEISTSTENVMHLKPIFTSVKYILDEPQRFHANVDEYLEDYGMNLLMTENTFSDIYEEINKGKNTKSPSNFETSPLYRIFSSIIPVTEKLNYNEKETKKNTETTTITTAATLTRTTTENTISFQTIYRNAVPKEKITTKTPPIALLRNEPVSTKGTIITEMPPTVQLRTESSSTEGTPLTDLNDLIEKSTKARFPPTTSENPVKDIKPSSATTMYSSSVTSIGNEVTDKVITLLSSSTPEIDNVYDIKRANETLLAIIGLILKTSTESTTQSKCRTGTSTEISEPKFRTDFSTTTTTPTLNTKTFLPVCTTTGRYPSKICNQYYECVRIMWWLQAKVRTCRIGEAFNSETLSCQRDNSCRVILY